MLVKALYLLMSLGLNDFKPVFMPGLKKVRKVRNKGKIQSEKGGVESKRKRCVVNY